MSKRRNTETIIETLRGRLGPEGVFTDPAEMQGYLQEWRGKYVGQTPAIVRPASTEDCAFIVNICRDSGIALVPQGGNTGLVGGSLPGIDGGEELLLSTTRMNTVSDIDTGSASLRAEAGATIADVQHAARQHDMMFPLSLASEGSCTVGGTIATNAGGIHVLRYGSMRTLVRGVDAVLGTGDIVRGCSPLVKDNTGYALAPLLCGSEGTLGIVTAATLNLVPPERHWHSCVIGVNDLAAAVRHLSDLKDITSGSLSAFEVMSDVCIDLAVRHLDGVRHPVSMHTPWYILFELGLSQPDDAVAARLNTWLQTELQRGTIADGMVAQSEHQRAALWRMREGLSEAQKREGISIKHDISLPQAGIADFVSIVSDELHTMVPGSQMVVFGHLGDGNLHFNLMLPNSGTPHTGGAETETALWDRVQDHVHGRVADYGGSLSAEHGIGRMKKVALRTHGDPGKLAAMRSVKAALDPDGIMNPGVLFD